MHYFDKHGLFLRVYESKDKFRPLTVRNSNKNKALRQVSIVLPKNLMDFVSLAMNKKKKLEKKIRPVDII